MFALDIILILVFIKLGITDSITKSRFNINLIWAVIFLASCGVGSSSNSTSNSLDVASSSQDIQIGNVPTIPTDNRSAGEYIIVPINNNINKSVTLGNMQLASNGAKTSTKLFKSYLDSSDCVQIPANSTCRLKVYTSQLANSYLLQMTFVDSSGRVHNATQVLSAHNQLPNINGFIYDASNLSLNDGLTNTLTIPFRLADNYSNISVIVDNNQVPFSCHNNVYTQDTLCNAIVTSEDLNSNYTLHNFRILGYSSNKTLMARSSAILSLTNSQKAHIITSGINVTVSPDDGTSPQQVFLYNNGKVSATNLTISPATPIAISSNTCGSTLASGATCSFYVNVTGSITSGQSSVSVNYSDNQNAQVFYFNVSYISPSYSPSLTMTTSGSFSNVTTGSASYMGINIINSGNTPLRNLQFSNVTNQESTISSFIDGSTCYNGITLGVNKSCVVMLSFSPTSAISGTVNFIPVGIYTGQAGESLSYSNSSLSIAYSGVSYSGFIAVGDYGSVFSSTSFITTWSPSVNTPFTATTTSANGLVINGNTYAITLNNGNVYYSTLNGLFWKNNSGTKLSSSTCGILYDGSFYYTCGISQATAGNCTTTGRGCIIRNNDLTSTSWTGLYQPAQAVAINNIFYFIGNSNNAYVATVSNSTSNTGLATSTTGGTWAATSSGQATSTNNNMRCAAFNSGTQNVTAWNSVGWNSTRAIATIGTAWTANTTTRPANSSVNGAIFQNGLYSVINTAGNIYTSTTPTSAYTQVYTGATQLNGITYGNGTYLTVGNNGTILESATGGTWTAKTSYVVGQSTNPNLNSASYDGTNFWITGVNTIAKSPTSATPSWTRPALVSITKNGSNYLAVDNQGFIYSASALTTWSQESNPSGKILNTVYCVSTNLCFAVGESGTILKTTDGTNWTQLTSGTSVNLYGITCQQGVCVVTGGTGDNTGTVLTSSDYTNWTIQVSNIAKPLFSVTYYSGLFIAVGDIGRVYVSTNNGITWQLVFNNGSGTLKSVACGNGCVAVGNSGLMVYSGSGNTWSVVGSLPTSNNLNSVAYNGSFVVTGNAGIILYNASPGTTSWSTATFPVLSSSLTNLYGVVSN